MNFLKNFNSRKIGKFLLKFFYFPVFQKKISWQFFKFHKFSFFFKIISWFSLFIIKKIFLNKKTFFFHQKKFKNNLSPNWNPIKTQIMTPASLLISKLPLLHHLTIVSFSRLPLLEIVWIRRADSAISEPTHRNNGEIWRIVRIWTVRVWTCWNRLNWSWIREIPVSKLQGFFFKNFGLIISSFSSFSENFGNWQKF